MNEIPAISRQSVIPKEVNDIIDAVEEKLVKEYEPIECPVTHSFIPGFYIRTIFMPAGSRITSKIHMTTHCYHVSSGKLSVWVNGEWVLIKAPYSGVTQAGTRRVLRIWEDTIWSCFHQTDKKTVEEVEEDIIEPHINPLLNED